MDDNSYSKNIYLPFTINSSGKAEDGLEYIKDYEMVFLCMKFERMSAEHLNLKPCWRTLDTVLEFETQFNVLKFCIFINENSSSYMMPSNIYDLVFYTDYDNFQLHVYLINLFAFNSVNGISNHRKWARIKQ